MKWVWFILDNFNLFFIFKFFNNYYIFVFVIFVNLVLLDYVFKVVLDVVLVGRVVVSCRKVSFFILEDNEVRDILRRCGDRDEDNVIVFVRSVSYWVIEVF